MKKVICKMAATALMVVCLLSLMVAPASAATESSGTSTQTITVTTQSNWSKPGHESITLSQNKGIRTDIFGWNHYRYGTWKISYVNVNDESDCGNATLSGGSVKINLGRDQTYTITVEWDWQAELFGSTVGSFSTYPTWKVKSTCKVSSYS